MKEFKFSIALLNEESLHTDRAKIIHAKITEKELKVIAEKMKFNYRRDDQSLLGYHYLNGNGDCLVSYPDFYKLGETINLR